MKLFSLQENLKFGLSMVSHLAGKNINLPILNNIMINVNNGNIKLIATNLEMGIINSVRGKIEAEGSFTVDAKTLTDAIVLLPNKKVSIQQKENTIMIDCENNKIKIKGQSAEEFPLIPEVERKKDYSADAEEFKHAISQVIFAVAASESRLELSGVLFSLEEGGLVLAATDSYRLAEKRIAVRTDHNESRKVIVPAKTLQELLRILSAGSEGAVLAKEQQEIKFYISENQILFVYGSTELVSRLIEGQYPDYQQIIPGNSRTKTEINRAEFIRSVKLAALFSKTGINDINLDFPAGKNQVIVSAVSGQTGENITRLEARVAGDDNGIVINYRYLLDGLNNINSEIVNIEIIDGNTPCILRPASGDNYLYIIMPIKQ